MQVKRRDVQRFAALLRIPEDHTDLYSTRQQRQRIYAAIINSTLCHCSIDRFNLLHKQASAYNQTWIVKRRAYGKRSKIRRYWAIYHACTDHVRRLNIINRIEALSCHA